MSGKKGARAQSPQPATVARNVIWQSMRKLRRFTAGDLEAVAEAGKGNVRRYVKELADAGYLRCVQPVQSGTPGGHAVWQLARDTGPVPPRISADGVYDANLADPRAQHCSAKLRRHAPAMMKALREILDRWKRADDVLAVYRASGILTDEFVHLAKAMRNGEAALDAHDGEKS